MIRLQIIEAKRISLIVLELVGEQVGGCTYCTYTMHQRALVGCIIVSVGVSSLILQVHTTSVC